jgi:Tfp pilus assembly protein PilZ
MDVTRFEKSAPPEKNLKNEKDPRQYIRRPYNKRLLFTYNQRAYKGLVTDLSHGGAFIETADPFAVGSEIYLTVSDPDGRNPFMITAKVAKRRSRGINVTFDKLPEKKKGLIKALKEKLH